MARAIRKIKVSNPWPRIAKRAAPDEDAIMRRYAFTTRLIARRSMRKAPKRPKSRFGQLRQRRTGKRRGTYFWQKGMYSRPGHPPFYHGSGNDGLRDIRVRKGGMGMYTVGPHPYAGSKVPSLHEKGGTIRMRNTEYRDKMGKKVKRPDDGNDRRTAKYPPRPYMRPALIKAKKYATASGASRRFTTAVNTIQRMKARRRVN